MRVVIDARISPDGYSGGVENFILGLIRSLGRLESDGEHYTIAVPRSGSSAWIDSYLGSNQELVQTPTPAAVRLERLASLLGPLARPASALRRWLRPTVRANLDLPISQVFDAQADVIHFPHQRFVRTGLPSLFNPHDLQHLHHPEFFSSREVMVRSQLYEKACDAAEAIATDSQWAKDDLIDRFNVDPATVYVMRWGPGSEFFREPDTVLLEEVKTKYDLPERFALYPARTWPHKNHLSLLEAMHLLRQKGGLDLSVVCTGRETPFVHQINQRVEALGLQGSFIRLGYVEGRELRGLYRLASLVVFPSLFEGGGFPILEAFLDEAPLACSRSTAIPEYAGDAAVYFDPSSPEDIAEKLAYLVSDQGVRRDLIEAGRRQLARFSWNKMARTYRAAYRMLGRLDLSEEDQLLLQEAQGKTLTA